eukprot:RCo046858
MKRQKGCILGQSRSPWICLGSGNKGLWGFMLFGFMLSLPFPPSDVFSAGVVCISASRALILTTFRKRSCTASPSLGSDSRPPPGVVLVHHGVPWVFHSRTPTTLRSSRAFAWFPIIPTPTSRHDCTDASAVGRGSLSFVCALYCVSHNSTRLLHGALLGGAQEERNRVSSYRTSQTKPTLAPLLGASWGMKKTNLQNGGRSFVDCIGLVTAIANAALATLGPTSFLFPHTSANAPLLISRVYLLCALRSSSSLQPIMAGQRPQLELPLPCFLELTVTVLFWYA